MTSPKGILGKILGQYDKLLILLVFAGLVSSLVFLAMRVGMKWQMKEDFIRQIDGIRPGHPLAAAADVSAYQREEGLIREPFQLGVSSNAVFIPETRCWCVDCRRPIPFAAVVCPFCSAPQPPEAGDDPRRDDDPRDAELDSDNDGFSNLEEYLAGTNPKDPNDHPSIEAKIHVDKIVQDPFKLRFKTVSKMPDGLKFQLNLRGDLRSYFAKMGETIEGFKLVDYRTNLVERTDGGMTRRVDESVLVLERGDKRIELVKGKDVQWNEFTVILSFAVDNSRYTLKLKDEVEIKGTKYRLIEIDIPKQGVVLERLHDNKRFDITKLPTGSDGKALGTSDKKSVE